VTRHGLILLDAAAMPLSRMTPLASVDYDRAENGPIAFGKALVQGHSAQIFDCSSHARQHRAIENAGTITGKIFKSP
jgi:hypothetical protein